MNDDPFVSEFHNVTTVHPLGLVAVLVLGMASMLLPRRHAIVPMLILACFVAPAQRIVVLGLDFNLLRVMVLFGWARVLLRSEWSQLRWCAIDTVVIAWATAGTLAYSVLHGSTSALVFKLGTSFDAVGMFFLFRFLVRDANDILAISKGMALIAIPVAIVLMIERTTGRNAFAFFGGVPEFTPVRQGKLRAQGAFAHPILAGVFWASLAPLMASLWWTAAKERWLAIIGVGAAIVIIVACASSTPAVAFAAAMMAGTFFVIRHWMRWIWVGALMGVVGLHLIMNAPVWHLISRINLIGGSTGWHRFYLIDQAIQHVGEWWLLGTTSTAHWGWGLIDLTNQYVLEGVRGGLLTLCLFVLLIVLAFRNIGALLRVRGQSSEKQVLAWSLGVALFVHVVSFMAVSYFGQIIVLWYLTLAMIASLTNARIRGMARMPMSCEAVYLRNRECFPSRKPA